MILFEYTTTAIKSLYANKIRSFLSMLGIIIGVSNVILTMGILEGGRLLILNELGSLSSSLIYLYSSPYSEEFEYISQEEIAQIKMMPQIKEVLSEGFIMIKIKTENKQRSITVIGTLPSFKDIEGIKIIKGRSFLSKDLELQKKVCIIGSEMSKALFKREEPLGKEIRIQGINFKVIGVMKEKRLLGFEKFIGDVFYIPFTTAQRILGIKDISSVLIYVKDMEKVETTISQIKAFLKKRHAGKELFEIQSMKEIISTIKTIASIIALVIGCIAAISLLVGGIGIMNIMLVSVKERTREIGIRRALGARHKDIFAQFLIESCIISSIGGVIGIMVGIMGVNILALVFDIPSLINLQFIILGFIISIFVGIFSGVYPAKSASSLFPIDALRYE